MSAKKTFEAKAFAANSFACGTWRGLGAAVSTVLVGTWSNIYTVTVNQPLIELYGNETITLSATSQIEVINGTP